MRGIVRLGDICTGHGCWPPRPSVTASQDVFVNGRGVVRVGDGWAVHCCVTCHASNQANGAPSYFANGRNVARIGDAIACGSSNATGSQDCFG